MGIDTVNDSLSCINEWEFIYPPNFDNILDSLAKEGMKKATWPSNSTGHHSPLIRMLNELFMSLLERIDDIIDAISLRLSCKHLLCQGHKACSLRIAGNIGFWADARLARIKNDDAYFLDEAPMACEACETQNDEGQIDLAEI